MGMVRAVKAGCLKAEGQDELTLFELVADAGAEDLVLEEDQFIVTTPVEAFGSVQSALEAAGIPVEDANLQRIPTMTKALPLEEAQKVAALLEKIEEHQDVQSVNSTLEFDEELVAALG